MSFWVRDLVVGGVLASLGLALGCTNTPPPPDGRNEAYQAELRQLRENYETELAEKRRALAVIRDEFDLQERRLQGLARELGASREHASSQELAATTALKMLREKEEEIAQLESRLDSNSAQPTSGGELAGAIELLRQKEVQIEGLRTALLQAQSGGERELSTEVERGIQLASLDLNQPVARVDGVPYSRRQFAEFLYRDLATPQLLGLFLNRILVLREARRQRISISDVDRQVWLEEQLIKHVQSAGSEAKFEERLRESGYDRESWLGRLRYQAEAALALERLVNLRRATPQGQEAFEARLKALFRDQYGERVSARHILFRVDPDAPPAQDHQAQRQADLAYQSLSQRGASFAELARKSSQDPESARLGGHMGVFGRLKYQQLPTLNTALFTAKVGQISRPVRSLVGYHILLVEERIAPRHTFPEVRARLVQELQAKPPSDEELGALLEELRKDTEVERALKFADE